MPARRRSESRSRMFWARLATTLMLQSRMPAVRVPGCFRVGILFAVSIRDSTQPILGHQSLNRSAIESEYHRRTPFPALILVKDELQIPPLQLIHRRSVDDNRSLVARGGSFLRNSAARRDFRGEAVERNHVIWAKGNGTAHGILELADIAGKSIRAKS